MNLKQALTIFADHINQPGNKSGSTFYVAALGEDARRYLLSRGLITMEWAQGTKLERLTGWAHLTLLGEREYERVLGEDPYESQTAYLARQYDRAESARTLSLLKLSAKNLQRYQTPTMVQVVRARVAFYLGPDGQRSARTHEVI